MTDYDSRLNSKVQDALEVAQQARSKGDDPKEEVEIEIADDIAGRCEKLLGISGLSEEIRKLEDKDLSREQIAFSLTRKFAAGKIGNLETDEEKIDAATRTAVALLTEGVVAAPIEGIGEISIEQNDDGSDFIRLPFFGPIRSAGGTGQALSVLIADYIRQQLGISAFQPRDDEVERYIEELRLYDGEVGLQYMPKEKETRTIVKNLPIMVDGAGTSDREVEGFRDLERINGNQARGGMCLVIGEGIAQKAPKIKRYTRDIEDMDAWNWLDDLELVTGGDEDEPDNNEDLQSHEKNKDALNPNDKYMQDIIAGRPVFAGPGEEGGFRLRYGRARNTGLAATGYHPATMVVVDRFLATGTQLKTEKPGKAAGTAPVDDIEGPTVELADGSVKQINNVDEARRVLNGIEKIYDLGETAVPYGEFVENNHPLIPSPYVPEWWQQDAGAAGANPDKYDGTAQTAFELAEEHDIPLHPDYTYLWHDITTNQYKTLSQAVEKTPDQTKLPSETHEILATLLVEHDRDSDNNVILDKDDAYTLSRLCNTNASGDTALEHVNNATDVTVKERAPIRIGTRMGRPEKSARREMKPSVHTLFPVGEAGGDQRSVFDAADHREQRTDLQQASEMHERGTIVAEVANRYCTTCEAERQTARCPDCNNRTQKTLKCNECETKYDNTTDPDESCEKCGSELSYFSYQELSVRSLLNDALNNVNTRRNTLDKLKGVKGLTSKTKLPEPLEKGILRSKHNVEIFRDGTARYDMVDLPLTSFRPEEFDLSVEEMHTFGYTETINGNPLEREDQYVQLKQQDIVISDDAGDYMLSVANYVDDLLQEYYNLEPYYNANTKHDLIGEIVVGLAPHTSAGVSARLIGYTSASTNYAHPYFHAAKRRNCFHPDTELTAEINGEWKRTTIKELVEEYLDPETDGYDDSYADGAEVQTLADHPDIDTIRVPSMNDQEMRTIEEATHLSRHPAPDHMVNLELSNEETLQVTPEHKIPVVTEAGPRKKRAHEIERGDTLYDYNEDLVNTVTSYQDIDILEEALDSDLDLDSVMIRGMEKEAIYDIFRDIIQPEVDGRFYKMKSSCEYLGITKTTLDNYLRRESIPVSLLRQVFETDDAFLQRIPQDINLGMNSDNTDVPRIITLDEELATLIGYYTAEGYTRAAKDSRVNGQHDGHNQTGLCGTEEEAREFFIQTIERKFNVQNSYKREEQIVASGRLVRFFFKDILDSGRFAHKKEVPELVMEADETIIGAYLSGYISGDGCLRNGTLSTTTVSEELHEGLQSLYDKLGLSYQTFEIPPKNLHSKFPGWYDEDTDKMSKKGYGVRTSKEAKQEFVRRFGVQLSRKEGADSKQEETVKVDSFSYRKTEVELTYNITVAQTHKMELESLSLRNCDSDEDGIMLLMDGLLNFSREYLPDIRGKRSVSKDTNIVVKKNGELGAPEISTLVDGAIEEGGFETRPDGFEVCKGFEDEIEVVSFGEDGAVDFSEVSALIRHPNDKRVFEVGTEKGSITVTEDHSVFVFEDSEVREREVGSLEEGDEIVVPSRISLDKQDREQFGEDMETIGDYIGRIFNDSQFSTEDSEEASLVSMLCRSIGRDTSVIHEDGGWVVSELGAMREEEYAGDLSAEEVTRIERVEYGDEYVYDLEVPGRENFLCGPHSVFAHNTMDAPLVLSSTLDPFEIDDEAHNVDIAGEYSREFYEATHELRDPGDVDVAIAEDELGEVETFDAVFGASSLSAGPVNSSYKELGSMREKTMNQLDLARRTRAIDEEVVAEEVVEQHFFPDIIGNLRAFARQDVRCPSCNAKYRRVPLGGECENCGGSLILTVHEGSVRKYLDISQEIADEYGMSEYAQQRLDQLVERIDSVFQDDKEKQTGLGDFV